MNRDQARDYLLLGSVALGLFLPWALGLIPFLVLLRDPKVPLKVHVSLGAFLLAVLWAAGVVGVRGLPENSKALLQYVYLWSLPFALAIAGVTKDTLARMNRLVLILFVLDLAFNLYSVTMGVDPLGRVLDGRSGVLAARYGGLFAHSFYSGSISIAALVILLAYGKGRLLVLVIIANLLMAGSWRLILAIPVLFLLNQGWRTRGRARELVFVLGMSLLTIGGTIATSGLVPSGLEENPSNSLRVYAWVTAIEKISQAPLGGVGFPKDNELKAISYEVIDESLTAESWYLSSALTYGIPYTLLTLAGYLFLFYGPSFHRRNGLAAILFPFVFIDLTTGGFFGGTLIYSWLWIIATLNVNGQLPGPTNGDQGAVVTAGIRTFLARVLRPRVAGAGPGRNG